mgnify:CR=1 FL=1
MDEKFVQQFIINKTLSLNFDEAKKITDKWGFIRQLYMDNLAEILKTSEESITRWTQPYYFDWASHFSPIEEVAWNSIRSHGRIVLYPQFPVFNYFIDFANPYLKIGLELDGKEYHNLEKDKTRDELLSKIGWKIFRVSGKEANADYLELSDLHEKRIFGNEREEALRKWLTRTLDGVIFSIKYFYFEGYDNEAIMKEYPLDDECQSEGTINLEHTMLETLKSHCLVPFDLPSVPNSR